MRERNRFRPRSFGYLKKGVSVSPRTAMKVERVGMSISGGVIWVIRREGPTERSSESP